MKPSCYNRPPFKDTATVRDGWRPFWVKDSHTLYSPLVIDVPDPMSKTCQQHGPMGEATLHPEKWDCEGCCWKPEE